MFIRHENEYFYSAEVILCKKNGMATECFEHHSRAKILTVPTTDGFSTSLTNLIIPVTSLFPSEKARMLLFFWV
jgi:hypothetical protein